MRRRIKKRKGTIRSTALEEVKRIKKASGKIRGIRGGKRKGLLKQVRKGAQRINN